MAARADWSPARSAGIDPAGRREASRGDRVPPRRVSGRRTLALAAAGAAAFWVVNFAISLTPLAAGYRESLSIAYGPMLVEALAAGLVIGWLVAYLLQRYFDRLPPRRPVFKGALLAGGVIVVAMVLIPAPDPGSFLVGVLINVLRILALGLVIGVLGGRPAAGRRG